MGFSFSLVAGEIFSSTTFRTFTKAKLNSLDSRLMFSLGESFRESDLPGEAVDSLNVSLMLLEAKLD